MDAYKGHDVVIRAMAALPASIRDRLHYVVAGRARTLMCCVRWRLNWVLAIASPGSASWTTLRFHRSTPARGTPCSARGSQRARGRAAFSEWCSWRRRAAGIPVLGTRAGGIPDAVVEGRGGWLVDQDDVDGVLTHLVRLAEDVASFRAQGARGRDRARGEASWDRYVSKLLAVIEGARESDLVIKRRFHHRHTDDQPCGGPCRHGEGFAVPGLR